jgi:RNA polymerase sigma-70 factor (ECF subfamily)
MNVSDRTSDEQLVGRCQVGDFAAFGELYLRYQRPILAYIYQITKNYEEAGNIAQDVFLKVFEHVERFDLTRRFSTWFYTIARNAAIDYLQARNRRVMVTFTDLDREDERGTMGEVAPAKGEPVETQLARSEANELLRTALAELPQLYREIIELVIFQDRSYEDASAILGGVSLGTLRSRMFHALRRLRTILQSAGGEDGGDLV